MWALCLLCFIVLSAAKPLNEFHDKNFDFHLPKGTPHAKRASGNPLADDLENFFITLNQCDTMQVPGSALSIVFEGETLLETVYGKSDVENNIDVTHDSQFGIGSTTKAITSWILASLIDQGTPLPSGNGNLTWTTKISEVIPDWFANGRAGADFDATLHDALTHRLNLLKNNYLWFFNISADVTSRVHETFPPIGPLRYNYDYFNIGYTIAASVAERITGKTITQLFREKFFAPLGMEADAYATAAEALNSPHYAYPYARTTQDTVVPLPRRANTIIDQPLIAPAGAINMNIRAVSKYLKAIQSGMVALGVIESFPINTGPQEATFPFSPYILGLTFGFNSYGYGWLSGQYRGYRLQWHNGGTVGHSTLFINFPDVGLSVGILSNQLAVSARSHIFFALYAFDRILGFDPILSSDIICLVGVGAAPVGGSELWKGLTDTVTNPTSYTGNYCNCLWKEARVTPVSGTDKLKLTLGVGSGLLRGQDGSTFKWFFEDWCEPEEMTVRFEPNGLWIDLNAEEVNHPQPSVFFQRRSTCQCP